MNHTETVASLIALANNDGASVEERRTAALTAVQIMHRRNMSPESTGARSFNEEHERRMVRISMTNRSLELSSRLFGVLNGQFEHQSIEASGRAELNRLCFALAGLAGDAILGIDEKIDEHLEEVRSALPVVVAAFREWETKQGPYDQNLIRTALVELFQTQSKPDIFVNAIAARLHCRASDVQAMLEKLVSEGFIRYKGGQYSLVKRRPKPKADESNPKQGDFFAEGRTE